uniref:phosphatidylinositol-specific phospholipase C domain-containing protein n=1 Tax=Photorhabdus sp. RM322S TaxID=3342825 RepID=UPI0036DF89D2
MPNKKETESENFVVPGEYTISCTTSPHATFGDPGYIKIKVLPTFSFHNWMKAVPNSQPLANMTIFGTHNSCARRSDFVFGKCQTYNLAAQLRMGARYLDIRCCVKKGSFQMHHGPIDEKINFDDVMNQCLAFLRDNPSETILMRIKQEHSTASNQEFMNIFDGKYGEYRSSMYFNPSGANVSLGAVRNKITIISNVKTLAGIQWDDIRKQDFDSENNVSKKWKLVKDQLDSASSAYAANYSGFYFNGLNAHNRDDANESIEHIAKEMRKKLLDYLKSTSTQYYGILATDHIDIFNENDMKTIISCNNITGDIV